MKMRRAWFRLLVSMGLFGAFGSVALVSGLVPVTASSGHWAVTEWLLHFAMRRSVSTHALSVPNEPTTAPWSVLKGAGHYEGGCRPCHGAPDLEPPWVPRAMTPFPPSLSDKVTQWNPRELFYIVKHGVKFTGMPGWPTQLRDDEVWSVVAFLKKLPKLDARSYRALVHAEQAEREVATPIGELVASESHPEALVQSCARCHGLRGEGRGSAAFPALAGQSAGYLRGAIEAYASGARHSGMMQPIALALSKRQIQGLASYYAEQPENGPLNPADEREALPLARGERIARQGVPERDLPPCAKCHSPEGEKKNPDYPKLAGQFADYLVLQLELFKENRRGGSKHEHLMRHIAERIERAEMRDVALYYASLRGDAGEGAASP